MLNAEAKFIPELEKLALRFPHLKIVLEHATTAEAVEMVKRLGSNVACTITVHHLFLTVDDWAGKSHNYCKPVAKTPRDRQALRNVVLEGHERFFLGSDSAPHLRSKKECAVANAGVYTTPHLMEYLAEVLEELNALDRLADFCCHFGRRFYGLSPVSSRELTLVRETHQIPAAYHFFSKDGTEQSVVPFMAGQSLKWKIKA